jgi:hypothetical protein
LSNRKKQSAKMLAAKNSILGTTGDFQLNL